MGGQIKHMMDMVSQKSTSVLRHMRLLQYLCTAIDAIEKVNSHYDKCLGTEKVLLWNAEDGQAELLENILELSHDDFGVEEICMWLILIYSVIAPECELEDEEMLKSVLKARIMQQQQRSLGWLGDAIEEALADHFNNQSAPSNDDDQSENKGLSEHTKQEIEDSVMETIRRLQTIRENRAGLKSLRELILQDEEYSAVLGQPTCYHPLLKQLAKRLVHNETTPDIVQSHGLLKSLSSTFGRLMFQSYEPKYIPDNCKQLIIFVVGGITAAEIADMQQQFRPLTDSRQDLAISVGGTCVTSPSHIYNHVLCRQRS